ncbi:hypothetical protein B0H12DRAFT_958916, partial [Mycena haematopus]
ALSFMAIAQAAQPSGTPSCTESCPSQDGAGFPLGADPTYYSSSGGVLFCSYPAYPGENPNDFFCTYNSDTGSTITDNDVGFCPPTAVESCNARR